MWSFVFVLVIRNEFIFHKSRHSWSAICCPSCTSVPSSASCSVTRLRRTSPPSPPRTFARISTVNCYQQVRHNPLFINVCWLLPPSAKFPAHLPDSCIAAGKKKTSCDHKGDIRTNIHSFVPPSIHPPIVRTSNYHPAINPSINLFLMNKASLIPLVYISPTTIFVRLSTHFIS